MFFVCNSIIYPAVDEISSYLVNCGFDEISDLDDWFGFGCSQQYLRHVVSDQCII